MAPNKQPKEMFASSPNKDEEFFKYMANKQKSELIQGT